MNTVHIKAKRSCKRRDSEKEYNQLCENHSAPLCVFEDESLEEC